MLIEATAASATAATNIPDTFSSQKTTVADKIKEDRKEEETSVSEATVSAEKNEKVQSEELLDKIKALQDNGRYSVRFEQNDDTQDTVVKIWDINNDELIRQIPAEDLIDFKTSFQDLVGNIVDTKG